MSLNLKKLMHSKWSSVSPIHKEKHFQIVKVIKENEESQKVMSVVIEAVLTKRRVNLALSELDNKQDWKMGWH